MHPLLFPTFWSASTPEKEKIKKGRKPVNDRRVMSTLHFFAILILAASQIGEKQKEREMSLSKSSAAAFFF